MATLMLFCPEHGAVECELEMPDITSMRYAALRVAEEYGNGPYDARFFLRDINGQLIDEDDMASEWDGKEVLLDYKR